MARSGHNKAAAPTSAFGYSFALCQDLTEPLQDSPLVGVLFGCSAYETLLR